MNEWDVEQFRFIEQLDMTPAPPEEKHWSWTCECPQHDPDLPDDGCRWIIIYPLGTSGGIVLNAFAQHHVCTACYERLKMERVL